MRAESVGTSEMQRRQGYESRRSKDQKYDMQLTRLPCECGNSFESRSCPGCHGLRGQSMVGLRSSPLLSDDMKGESEAARGRWAYGNAELLPAGGPAVDGLCVLRPAQPRHFLPEKPWSRLRKPLHGQCWNVTRHGNGHRDVCFPSCRQHPQGAGRGGAVHPTQVRPIRPRARPCQLLCCRICPGEWTTFAKRGSVFLN